jgi:hypothetical protein
MSKNLQVTTSHFHPSDTLTTALLLTSDDCNDDDDDDDDDDINVANNFSSLRCLLRRPPAFASPSSPDDADELAALNLTQ